MSENHSAPMQKYIRALQQYCKENPPDHENWQSVMNLLYRTYAAYNPIDEQKIRDGFTKLRSQFPGLSLQEFDPIFDIVSNLCSSYERLAFYEGLRLGVTLMLELKECP